MSDDVHLGYILETNEFCGGVNNALRFYFCGMELNNNVVMIRWIVQCGEDSFEKGTFNTCGDRRRGHACGQWITKIRLDSEIKLRDTSFVRFK